MTVGEKIKIARKIKGLTQKELGFLVDLTSNRIMKYENGIRNPKESVLKEIADGLGVSVEYFTDFNIDTYNNVMHMLFELDTKYGIDISPSDNILNDLTQYSVSFKDNSLNARIGSWHKEIMHLDILDALDELDDEAKEEYELWKLGYPISDTIAIQDFETSNADNYTTQNQDTIGEMMSKFFDLSEKLGIDLSYDNVNNEIDSKSLTMKIQHDSFNKHLCGWIDEKNKFEKLKEDSKIIYPNLSSDKIGEKFLDASEIKKQILIASKEKI